VGGGREGSFDEIRGTREDIRWIILRDFQIKGSQLRLKKRGSDPNKRHGHDLVEGCNISRATVYSCAINYTASPALQMSE
jgi:hypothetical protein